MPKQDPPKYFKCKAMKSMATERSDRNRGLDSPRRWQCEQCKGAQTLK